MATRPFKEHSDRFISRLKENVERRTRPIEEPQLFNQALQILVAEIHDYIGEPGANLEHLQNSVNAPPNLEWVRRMGIVRNHYNFLHNLHSQICDEEAAIYRIERKSQLIALLFRFLTTISIGIGILIVYWIAGKLDIAMPLLRIM